MKKIVFLTLLISMVLIFIILIACSSGDKTAEKSLTKDKVLPANAERVRKFITDKMKRIEKNIKVMNAREAFKLAKKEARKWDSNARLYEIEGKDKLVPEGTAVQWLVYFATREDPEKTPGREQGKKFVVIVLDNRVVSAEKKETPNEIKYTAECHAFLPDNWMKSGDAYSKCFAAIKDKYSSEADNGEPRFLVCRSNEYRAPGGSGWERKPAWALSFKIGNIYARADIHAITGEVLKVK